MAALAVNATEVLLDEKTETTGKGPAQRSFCRVCGTALWAWDPRWPELVHPFASAIDSDWPAPPERTHLMVGSKASWVELRAGKNDLIFGVCPEESIADWHTRLNLEDQSV